MSAITAVRKKQFESLSTAKKARIERTEKNATESLSSAIQKTVKATLCTELQTVKRESFAKFTALCTALHTHSFSFVTRINCLLEHFTARPKEDYLTHSLILSVKEDLKEPIHCLIDIFLQAHSSTPFYTQTKSTSEIYHLQVFELQTPDASFPLGYNHEKPIMHLRASKDGFQGEILWIGESALLKGIDLHRIYSALEPLFTGVWALRDTAQIKGCTESAEKKEFAVDLRYALLSDPRGTWYQRVFGFREVAHLTYQNQAKYDEAVKKMRAYTISTVWSFIQKYEGAADLKSICRSALEIEPKDKTDFMSSSTKTLQELHGILLLRVRTAPSRKEYLEAQWKIAVMQKVLFNYPEDLLDDDCSAEEEMSADEYAYWDAVHTIICTDIFVKNYNR